MSEVPRARVMELAVHSVEERVGIFGRILVEGARSKE
jgi:hypothetical protein